MHLPPPKEAATDREISYVLLLRGHRRSAPDDFARFPALRTFAKPPPAESSFVLHLSKVNLKATVLPPSDARAKARDAARKVPGLVKLTKLTKPKASENLSKLETCHGRAFRHKIPVFRIAAPGGLRIRKPQEEQAWTF